MSEFESDLQTHLWNRVRAINEAWRQDQWKALEDALHPDVVFLPPALRQRVQGREACIRTYQDFVQQARVASFDERAPTVDVYGETGVVSYRFSINYQREEKSYLGAGGEIFVFVREGDRWLACFRAMVQSSEEEIGG